MRRSLPAVLSALLIALTACGSPTDDAGRPVDGSVATLDPGTQQQLEPAPSAPPTAGQAAPAPAAPLPAGTAPTRTFQVAKRQDTWVREGTRTLRVRTWYPNASGTFPVVLFSHGLNGQPEDFDPLLSRWAGAGFVVVAPAYPNTQRNAAQFTIADVLNQPADASYVLSQTLAGPLRTRVDGTRMAAAGHSAGGITTVGLFTGARDERLRAGIVLAGNAFGVGDAFKGTPASLLYVHGELDNVVSYASGRAAYDRTPWSKAMLTLKGQNHGDPYLRPNSAAYPAVTATTLDFLRFTLYGDTSARRRLPAGAGAHSLDNRL